MKIKSMEVINGFQHKHLALSFSDFNVIVGPNGCGKSSIAELLGFALTNTFSWPGNVDTIVTQDEEKGSVELLLEDEGEEILLKTALGVQVES